MMKWLKKFRQKSYSQKRRELEVREEIYSRMSNLSDNQMETWVNLKLEVQELKPDNVVPLREA